MKKKILIALTVILIIILIVCLFACNQTNGEDIYPNFVYDNTLYKEKNDRCSESNLRIMSYNVLVEDWNTKIVTGIKNPQQARIEQVAKVIDYYLPDVVAFQEFDGIWQKDLLNKMESSYKVLFSKGHFTNIIYNIDVLTLKDSGIERYSMKSDSRMRYIAWAKFIKNETNEQFFIINTHFDFGDKNKDKQRQQMKEYAEFAKNLYEINSLPVFLAGDYNAYDKEITDKNDPLYEYQQAVDLYDAFVKNNTDFISDSNYIDGIEIIDGTNQKYDQPKWDHIFVTNNVQVNRFAILSNDYYTACSDHFPIYIDVKI